MKTIGELEKRIDDLGRTLSHTQTKLDYMTQLYRQAEQETGATKERLRTVEKANAGKAQEINRLLNVIKGLEFELENNTEYPPVRNRAAE